MTYYTGLDVSLRSVSICIIDDKGFIQHEAKVAADVDRIVRCHHDFSAEVNVVAFEVGTLTLTACRWPGQHRGPSKRRDDARRTDVACHQRSHLRHSGPSDRDSATLPRSPGVC